MQPCSWQIKRLKMGTVDISARFRASVNILQMSIRNKDYGGFMGGDKALSDISPGDRKFYVSESSKMQNPSSRSRFEFDDCSHIKAGTQMAHFSHLTISPRRRRKGRIEGGSLIVASDNFMPQ